MTVYLLHFEKKIGNADNPHGQALHYIGYTSGALNRRLLEHYHGTGAAIMAHLAKNKIGFCVARTWPDGTRKLEKRLKHYKDVPSRRCPIYKGEKEYKSYQPKEGI